MKNPAPVYRYMFIISIGFLLVGMRFTITGIPAAELFSVLGGISVLTFYILFSRAAIQTQKSNLPRHFTVLSIIIGQVLKSFEIAEGTYLFLIALVSILVWITWSVLEKLPPSGQ